MEHCISMIDKALAISCEEIKAIDEKDIGMAEELFSEREYIMSNLGQINVKDKVVFREKLQELQNNQLLIIKSSQKLRSEYVTILKRAGKEGVRLSAYKRAVGQALNH